MNGSSDVVQSFQFILRLSTQDQLASQVLKAKESTVNFVFCKLESKFVNHADLEVFVTKTGAEFNFLIFIDHLIGGRRVVEPRHSLLPTCIVVRGRVSLLRKCINDLVKLLASGSTWVIKVQHAQVSERLACFRVLVILTTDDRRSVVIIQSA